MYEKIGRPHRALEAKTVRPNLAFNADLSPAAFEVGQRQWR